MKTNPKRIAIIGLLVVSIWGLIGLNRAFAAASPEEKKDRQMAGILYAYTNVNSDTGEESLKTKIFLPLRKTDVHLEVFAGITKATVTQVFTNDTPNALEAVYVFPLPAKAAVTDMVLKVEDRIIRSVIKEREEAKQTYEAAKAAGKKTALLEQERPNIFTTSVANFLPGETIEIILSYMEEVEYQKGMYKVNFPMIVGQRYIPCGETHEPAGILPDRDADAESRQDNTPVPDAERLNPPLLHPNLDSQHRLSLTAEIAGIPVKTIVSNTHAINIENISQKNEERYWVSLAGEVTVPDSDFNMKIYMKEEDSPQLSCIHSRKGEETYSMVTVFPPVSEGESSPFAIPRDVIFLIDTSGSMSGLSIGQARTGLLRCLNMLRPGDNFTIVRFASDFSYFSPDLRPVTTENVGAAKRYIDGLTADGGTEMQRALQYVLGIPKNQGTMKMIVFLTDGAVGNEDSLFRLLSNHLGPCRLFTFGIGSAPNEYLMQKMAEIGRGQSQFIHSEQDIGEVMANFFKTLDSPVLTDISLEWMDEAGNRVKDVELYPNPCPDVYYQRPIQVLLKHPQGASGKIIISGMLGENPVSYSYAVDEREARRTDAVDRMFGNAKIKELMFRHIQANSEEERELLRQEIIDVSLYYQVLSKFTARVAVEERVVRSPNGELETVRVKTPLPKGWDPSKFTSTASDIFLWLLVGGLLAVAGLIDFGIRRFIGSR